MNIKNITYNHNRQYFIIDLHNNQITYNNLTVPVTKESINTYFITFLNLMTNWQEEYLDTRLIDGSNWQITINFLDNHCKTYSGHGSYPANFEAIERLISQIISEVF